MRTREKSEILWLIIDNDEKLIKLIINQQNTANTTIKW